MNRFQEQLNNINKKFGARPVKKAKTKKTTIEAEVEEVLPKEKPAKKAKTKKTAPAEDKKTEDIAPEEQKPAKKVKLSPRQWYALNKMRKGSNGLLNRK